MTKKVYCVYDRVAEMSGPLFDAKNDGLAKRMYSFILNSSKVENESDYMLYCLGEYDDEKPSLEGYLVPTIINISEDDDE